MAIDESVAMIGHSFGVFPELSFLTDENLYEYGTIIVDPLTINSELIQKGGPPFRRHAHLRFNYRSEQLSTWVGEGHVLIFLVRWPLYWSFEYVDEGMPVSEILSPYEMSIFENIDFRGSSGSRVDYVGPANAELPLQPHLNRIAYEAIISGGEVRPILRVRGSKLGEPQLVGTTHSFGSGRIICMPLLNGSPEQQAEYLRTLAILPVALSAKSSGLPEWVDAFRTKEELQSLNEIKQSAQVIRKKQSIIDQEENTLAAIRELKALFAGTGEEFKDAVKAALQELGLQCVDGPHPRADLLASNGALLMTVEAKGLDGSARERNFRQVQSWKAEVDLAFSVDTDEPNENPDLKRYADQLKLLGIAKKPSQDCKGLMVIGTFKNTPLNERSLPDFPENVCRLLIPSNVCGITGLQLFGLILLVRSDPTLKEKIVASLFNTAGLLSEASDWREFLKQV